MFWENIDVVVLLGKRVASMVSCTIITLLLLLHPLSRQKCFRLLPCAAAGIVAFLMVFAWYVRSVPPKLVTTIPANSTLTPELMERLGPEALEQLTRTGILTKEGGAASMTSQPLPVDGSGEINLDAMGVMGDPPQQQQQQQENTSPANEL
jgi:hypothetical protein